MTQVRRNDSQVQLQAKVCVKSLPPDPQGNRTRISWDPWSIRAGSPTIEPDLNATQLMDEFPADATYRVGQCAFGWIPFATNRTVSRILYANGVGDRAVWDAANLAAQPTTGTRGTEGEVDSQPESRANQSAKDYANCKALNVDYPHGVGRPDAEDRTRSGSTPVTNFKASSPLYEANTKSDADNDGIACERH